MYNHRVQYFPHTLHRAAIRDLATETKGTVSVLLLSCVGALSVNVGKCKRLFLFRLRFRLENLLQRPFVVYLSLGAFRAVPPAATAATNRYAF